MENLQLMERLNYGVLKNDHLKNFLNTIDTTDKTRDSYKTGILNLKKWLDTNHINTPTRQDITQYKEHLKKTYSVSTANLYIQAVKLFFRFLHNELNIQDITTHLKKLNIERDHKKQPFTTEQIKQLLDIDTTTLKGKRDKAIMLLLLTTGARGSEILNANITDIQTIQDKQVLFIKGKDRTEKTDFLILTSLTIRALNDYLLNRQDKEQALFISVSNNHSTRLSMRSLSRIIKGYINTFTTNPNYTLHSTRHTYATQLLLNGASLQSVSQSLRHKNINTTLIYAHNIDKLNNNNNNLMETILKSSIWALETKKGL